MYIVNRTQTDFDFETYIHCIYYGNMGQQEKAIYAYMGNSFCISFVYH